MARTEARLDATGAVTRRRSAGPWEPVEPRTDWARVDATTEAEIERQAAFDDAEAAKDAAAWVRRVRRRAGLSQAEFARRIGISVATVRGWEQGKLVPQGAARALLRVIDRVPEAVLALSASWTTRDSDASTSNRSAADLEALADTLVRVSYLAMHLEGHLAELDINPLMVLPSGDGAAVRSGSEGGRRPSRLLNKLLALGDEAGVVALVHE
jgi:putative transcriptional regulator